jgi:ABC-type antimicrobial peptide transport system permease subunit
VRLKNGSPGAGLRSLSRIASATSTPADYGVSLLAVQRPAEIVNYRSMGGTPAILGGALAAGVAAALGLTLIASVRRRQRDLALFKTLGFTRGQLALTISWQSSIAVAIGTALGIPAGIIVGRSLWILFAHQINVVPTPTVPATTIVLIAVGALVLANLVAAIPARIAARIPTALLLRSE